VCLCEEGGGGCELRWGLCMGSVCVCVNKSDFLSYHALVSLVCSVIYQLAIMKQVCVIMISDKW